MYYVYIKCNRRRLKISFFFEFFQFSNFQIFKLMKKLKKIEKKKMSPIRTCLQ